MRDGNAEAEALTARAETDTLIGDWTTAGRWYNHAVKSVVLRFTLALVAFTLGVWTHMAWVAYCLPDLSPCGRPICY